MKIAKILRNIALLRPLFSIRDWLMNTTGLFKLKKKLKYRLFLWKLDYEDARLKKDIACCIENLPFGMLKRQNNGNDYIVSLTSYGKRVSTSVPYAIYSLFAQTVLPNRIVLWLDNEHWCDNNLPYLLKRLVKSGLEIYYCEDIRSYKKLIPSLKAFPDNPIIVVDDDFYYNKDFVKWMVDAYEDSNKRTVFGTWGCIPEKMDGKYISYSKWKDCSYGDKDCEISLFGGGGAIYPPHIFDDEVLRRDLFMKLSPTADDLWFWVQEIRNGVSVRLTPVHGYGLHRPVDRRYEYDVTGDGCLTSINVIEGQNDSQFQRLLEYYNLY